jgi:hypothetical protein
MVANSYKLPLKDQFHPVAAPVVVVAAGSDGAM